MKLALAMIVKPTEDEALLLSRALRYVFRYVDGIFLTITGESKECEEVAKEYNAIVSHFAWNNNFADARNFNFSQVPREYTHILWIDADDVVKGAEKIRGIIESNLETDAFVMNYFYAFDEHKNPVVVHAKTQIVKNDGCVSWAGALHEDFRENRKLTTKFIKDVSRLHISTGERAVGAVERNLTIAELEVEKTPYDPRSYWNLANAQKMAGFADRAIDSFKNFMEMSEADEEKYLVRLRLAEIYAERGEWTNALESVNLAIGIRSMYPNGYHIKGEILYSMNRFEEARDSVQQGLTMKPPYFSIIVFNPRDYDYNPLMLLAKIYIALYMPEVAIICIEQCAKIQPEDENLKKLAKELKKEAKKAE